jgi:uncharacterized protein
MQKLDILITAMIEYYSGDPKRIQHFIKVHSFAELIGLGEKLDGNTMLILEAAAVVHDIGIKAAEEKFGRCDGKLQEQEGPALAKEKLEKVGFEKDVIDRVSYLVGHHHTYKNIDGADYQILVEADFLVNLYEDSLPQEAVVSAYNRIFKTKTGRRLCSTMFKL